MNKNEVLKQAKAQRINEVMDYQINIDNYKLAINKIEELNDNDLIAFKNQLQELLQSSIVEQKKAQIMLDVISSQIEG